MEEISKEDFITYEKVRMSGVTNMYHISAVMELSGLSREKVLQIMKEYSNLMKKYPDVRNNV